MEQLSIFDMIAPEIKPGTWVKNHGKRVMFDDLMPGKLYIEDVGAAYPTGRWLRAAKVTRKTKDIVWMTDGSVIANQGHMMASRSEVDSEEDMCGWMFEEAQEE